MFDPSPVSGNAVIIVDDDPSVCRALERQLRANRLGSVSFTSACELLGGESWRDAGCFLLDIRMPQMSGVELARRLAEAGSSAPVILMSAHVEESASAVAAAHAVAFLPKPLDEKPLVGALRQALEPHSAA